MGRLRTIAERLSHGRSLWRTLPAPFSAARVLVTPDAALSYVRPGKNWCDPQLLEIVRDHARAGSVVWDVGANVGVFGVAAAVQCGNDGHVICIEPDIVLSLLIRKTATRLPPNAASLQVLSCAVSQQAGVAEFLIAARGRASNALAGFGRSQTGGSRERQLVPVTTLDDLLKTVRPPTLVKIDIEGAEAAALAGARSLLHDVRPTFYIEVGNENISDVTSIFKEAKYDLFDPAKPVAGQTSLDECLWNTVAIPRQP